MAPRRLHADVERSLHRVKSVIVKPRQNSVKIKANKKVNQAAKTIEHVVLDGQSGRDKGCIRLKIDGRDIDYFDGFVASNDLVSELLRRFRHSVIESLTIANFRDKMKIDDDLMAKFSVIFKTASVSKEVSLSESCFSGKQDRCDLMQLMNCFDSFKPKNLDIWHSTGMQLDDRSLQRFLEDRIHCVSLLHTEHSFSSNGVRGFFFDGDNSGEEIRSLDVGTGCNPIKRMASPFLHYFIQAARLPNAPRRFRLVAPVGDVRLNIRSYDRAVTTEGGAPKILLPQHGLVVDLPASGQQTLRIRRD